MSSQTTIQNRIKKDKELVLGQLRKTPIIETACQKLNIGRSSFYRWKTEDKDFAKAADEALSEGVKLVNDFAESQLLSAIKQGNLTGVMYCLNHRRPAYGNKLEVTASSREADETLTPGQQAIVKKALALTGFNKEKEDEK